jgi:hypothetical protein
MPCSRPSTSADGRVTDLRIVRMASVMVTASLPVGGGLACFASAES